MACYHPIPAWRRTNGEIRLNKELPDAARLQLPCGTCIGCRTTRAQHWALRCYLESLQHKHTCVTTLTYDDAHLPPTLQKRDFQLWLKRLRKLNASRIRYYACGEYGEKFGRPHYHAIVFGLNHRTETIAEAWQSQSRDRSTRAELGRVYTDNVSIEAVNYVVNYTQKKREWRFAIAHERMDPETGELYTWQPPFQLMSRGGRHGQGIGADAKKHWQSWELFAVQNGKKISTPRYYKEEHDKNTTKENLEETEWKRYKNALQRHGNQTQQLLDAKERQHYARQELYSALRRYE